MGGWGRSLRNGVRGVRGFELLEGSCIVGEVRDFEEVRGWEVW